VKQNEENLIKYFLVNVFNSKYFRADQLLFSDQMMNEKYSLMALCFLLEKSV